MKRYLDLVPISAKMHRKQSRMTIICITLSVFLVTTILGLTEMGVRMETARLIGKHGSLDFLTSGAAMAYYPIGVILMVLILIAGVLMISSSMNSNVSQRIKFFGMLRCIGMSKKQIIRFVRLEALSWCKVAIPIGLVIGTLFMWGICGMLKYVVGEEWSEIPMFKLSIVGLVAGVIIGLASVLLAARKPARKAAKVSPIEAVSGNAENTGSVGHIKNIGDLGNGEGGKRSSKGGKSAGNRKIETALGIHHAISDKKGLVLMASSFALSIILFLSFSVIIETVNHLLPQPKNASVIDVASTDETNSIGADLISQIEKMDSVDRVFGRQSALGIPMSHEVGDQAGQSNDGQTQAGQAADGQTTGGQTGDLISYSDFDLECLAGEKMLTKDSDISGVYGDSNCAIGISDYTGKADKSTIVNIGDKIDVNGKTVEVVGLLQYNPFTNDGTIGDGITLITSHDTFKNITGESDYSLVMIQEKTPISDEDVAQMQNLLPDNAELRDNRDSQTKGTYTAFIIFAYGFLAIITLVAFLNIINSISMSVTARMSQIGVFRAIGMDDGQIKKMIFSEAATFAVCGCLAGLIIGLPLHMLMYNVLVTKHFPFAIWHLPITALIIIIAVVALAAIVAALMPIKRIMKTSVVETINRL